METYSRIWVLRRYRNLQSYLSTARLTVVFSWLECTRPNLAPRRFWWMDSLGRGVWQICSRLCPGDFQRPHVHNLWRRSQSYYGRKGRLNIFSTRFECSSSFSTRFECSSIFFTRFECSSIFLTRFECSFQPTVIFQVMMTSNFSSSRSSSLCSL